MDQLLQLFYIHFACLEWKIELVDGLKIESYKLSNFRRSVLITMCVKCVVMSTGFLKRSDGSRAITSYYPLFKLVKVWPLCIP